MGQSPADTPHLAMATIGEAELEPVSKRSICEICFVQFSKYKCPRCDKAYCTLKCYQSASHSNCSENFYKECVVSELSNKRGSDDEKKKMIDILQRVNELEEEEQEDEQEVHQEFEQEAEELEIRLSNIDINDPDKVWNKLTKKEKEQFTHMYQSGTLAELVLATPPWWEGPLIQLLNEEEKELPSIMFDVPPLTSIVKNVSGDIPYNIINILYCYVYVWRYYNTSINDVPLQAIETLIELSSVLSENHSFSSVQDALDHPMGLISVKIHLFNSHHYSSSLVKDILLLIKGTSFKGENYVSLALADIINIISKAKELLKKTKNGREVNKKLFLIKKKLIFFISWNKERHEVIKLLIPLI